MDLIVASLLALLVIVLTRAFVINAMALKRDIDRRFDEFRIRLETEANSTLEGLLTGNPGKDSSNQGRR